MVSLHTASPARAEDLSGLSPAVIIVGELDLFVDEDIEYAQRLIQAGVSVELHVFPGAFHGSDIMAPDVREQPALGGDQNGRPASGIAR